MFNMQVSYMTDLFQVLKSELEKGGKQESCDDLKPVTSAVDLLKPEKFTQTMMREYISWIGLFTSSKQGTEILLQMKIFDYLRYFVDKQGLRDHILI